VGGDRADAARALARLEVVCDTYLSVSTPAQAAAADLLERGASIRQQIGQRISDNYRHLVAASAAAPACHVCHAEGGWYGVLQVPSLAAEEDLVLRLLTEDRVLVHPGYFFDFPHESFLILSLLPPTQAFATGLSRVLERVEPRLRSGPRSR
jgi:aspartate/methionine/tyrosine aminotransferase